MVLLGWVLFGIGNAFLLSLFANSNTNKPMTFFVSIAGAMSGGLFAYLLFSGTTLASHLTVFLLISMDLVFLLIASQTQLFRRTYK